MSRQRNASSMRTAILLSFSALAALAAGADGARAQDEDNAADSGITEYEVSCMSCHGLNGHGNGPDAARLAVKPADLTTIARRYGGTFPEAAVREMIDGRSETAAHGPRQMPVWGARYRAVDDPQESATEVDRRARGLIDALVEYLASIQQP